MNLFSSTPVLGLIALAVTLVAIVSGLRTRALLRRLNQHARGLEHALAQTAVRMRDVTTAAPHWFWETDAEGRFTWMSDSVERVTGVAAAWHYGKSRTEIAAQTQDLSVEPWRSHLATIDARKPFSNFRYLRCGPNGDQWLQVDGIPVIDHSSVFAGYRGVAYDITEEVRRQEQAEASNTQLRAAIENLNETIVLCDAEDRIVFANRRFRELSGEALQPHLVPGASFESYLRAALALGHFVAATGREEQWLSERLAQRRAPGEPKELERHNVWLLMTDQRLPGGGVISIGLDITERKRAEKALSANEQHLRLIMNHIPAMITYVSYAGGERRYTFSNDAYCQFIGKPHAEVVGHTVREVVGAAPYDRMVGPALDRVASGERVRYERAHHVSESADVMYLAMEFIPDRDAAGNVVGHYGLGIDISERRRAERAARENEARFRSLTALSSDFYWEQDAQFRFVFASNNDGFDPGVTQSERFGKTRWELPRSEPVGITWDEHRATLEAHHEFRDLIVKRTTEDGQTIYLSVSGTPINDDEGVFRGYRGVGRDVTSQRIAEETVHAAKLAAEDANRAKSQFLATMSHEIRTPMNGVLGMSELLMSTPLDDRQKTFAESIHRSGTALLGIINDILDFSKIEAGRLEIEQVDFDLSEAVGEVLDLVHESARRKSLTLDCQIAASVPAHVSGDPLRLRQVLTNLLSNAVKFTERGSITVEIDVAPEYMLQTQESAPTADSHSGLLFRVRDTGIGMDRPTLDRLFNAFTQADGSTTRRFGGTGLGLVICKQLAELMGGAIGVESEPGQGSTFWFSVRIAAAAKPEVLPVKRSDLEGIRALIVEDNPTNRGILQHVLGSAGLRVGIAEHGQKALEALHQAIENGQPYQLAIVDKKMPVMDGIELIRAVLADRALAKLKLIMLSSLDSPGERAEALQAGAAAYLSKPVRKSELLKAIATTLAVRRRADQADPSVLGASQREGRLRVLLAEDNRINREIAINMLDSLGYDVKWAANGKEASEHALAGHFDLVLMDCQMPVMDGLEATALIRSREPRTGKGGRIPIIALTANAMQGDRERCIEAGMDDYLAKPFTKSQLRETLRRWTEYVSSN